MVTTFGRRRDTSRASRSPEITTKSLNSLSLSLPQALKESLQEKEKKVEGLVELGNVLLASVGKGTAAEAEVDLTLTDSETRW